MYHFCEKVPMRDGILLHTSIALPNAKPEDRFNAILIRSPYGAGNGIDDYAASFLKQNLAFIIQECRGTYRSEGEADLWRQEADDGYDTLEWLSKQKWFAGKTVMNGESYPGSCQWQAARTPHKALAAITPHNAPLDIFHVAYYHGGAYGTSLGMSWAFNLLEMRRQTGIKIDMEKARLMLPYCDLDTALGFQKWNLWKTWMNHDTFDAFWEKHDAFRDIPSMETPAYITGGWFDLFLSDTLKAFRMMQSSANENVRRFTRCVIEPYDHNMALSPDVDYGDNPSDSIIEKRNLFMKNILADPSSDPLPSEEAMRYFVMGSNEWRTSNSWPPGDVVETPFYIHPNGVLSSEHPRENGEFDNFIYDPADPVMTEGGNDLSYRPGQRIQNAVEARSDVLVYTSSILEDDLTVTGDVRAVIYASSDAPDTDFTVRLCDVQPDGKSLNICDGLLRARFRNGQSKEDFLPPGEIGLFNIDMWSTAVTFRKGHRIRIQISSSNFPRFDRNHNTGKKPSSDTEMRIASQTVHHNEAYPSHIILPIAGLR